LKLIKLIPYLVFIFVLSSNAYSESKISESGKAGMSFLNIAPSANIASMGGASVARNTGASSIWSNPALIANQNERSLQLSHTAWVEGINQEFAAFSTKAGAGAFAIGLELFDSGDIEGRDDSGGETGPYSIKNGAVSISYARSVFNWIAVGVSYKKLYEKEFAETAGGSAVDAGLTILTPVKGLTLAASGRNYGSMEKLRDEKTELPSNLSIGGCYEGILPSLNNNFAFVVDAVFPKYGDNGIRLGLEVQTYDLLFLRAGYRNDSDFEDMTFGVGINFDKVSADISYSPLSGISDNALRFTINLTGF
jgi:hypothetical protein